MGARLVGAVGLMAIGCGGASPAPMREWSPEGEPLTVIEVADNTSWPFELVDVKVVLDGELLDADAPTVHERSVPIAAFASLPEGPHTLQVVARARFASTKLDGSDGCTAAISTGRTFYVGHAPVGILMDLSSDDVTRRFGERLDMTIVVAGEDEAARAAEGGCAAPISRQLESDSEVCRDDAPLPFDESDLRARRGVRPLID